MSQSDPVEEPDDLLLFAPVAQARRRADGWSPEVQRAFVGALTRCGTVAAAARSVGRSAWSAYHLRACAGGGSSLTSVWDKARHGVAETLSGGMAVAPRSRPRCSIDAAVPRDRRAGVARPLHPCRVAVADLRLSRRAAQGRGWGSTSIKCQRVNLSGFRRGIAAASTMLRLGSPSGRAGVARKGIPAVT